MFSARFSRYRGATAVVAMIMLVTMAAIATAAFYTSNNGTRIGYNVMAMEHATANAETGMKWMASRFEEMPLPIRLEGTITPSLARTLWGSPATSNSIANAIVQDLTLRTRSDERLYEFTADSVTTNEIWLDAAGKDRFSVTVQQSSTDPRILIVTATGYHGNDGELAFARRSVEMQFAMAKLFDFAVLGCNQVQIGANTLVEGNVAMRTLLSSGTTPVLCVSDFNHMAGAKAEIERFHDLLRSSTTDGGNRISSRDGSLWQTALDSGFADSNSDGFIDEYDVFLKVYDRSTLAGDFAGPTVTWLQEFADDAEWFKIANLLGRGIIPGSLPRSGYDDDMIDALDNYAKIRGQVLLGESMESLLARFGVAGIDIHDMIQGPVIPSDPNSPAIRFGADGEILDLRPSNFADACNAFRELVEEALNDTGPAAGKVIQNRTITAAMTANGTPRAADSYDSHEVVRITNAAGLSGKKANEGNQLGLITINNGVYVKKSVIDQMNATVAGGNPATYTRDPNFIVERFPYGATSVQATYKRPVFNGLTFKDCKIPRGLNAVFINCKFEGVTFVDTDVTVGNASNESQGWTWAATVVGSGSFSAAKPLVGGSTAVNGEFRTNGSTQGNNLRFESCTFEGPLAGTCPGAYTHFANSWEFNGTSPGTVFDNKWQDPNAGGQTVTILSPQVNIEMGSFGNQMVESILTGVVVGGNVDIRGKCIVDGALISLRRGPGTMTLGYFGPGDNDNNPAAMPEGGFGRILLRSNPLRALPYGIRIPIRILPDVATYKDL